MREEAADLEAGWRAWRVARNERGMRTLLFIVLVLYPLFGVLDVLVAPPDALPWLLGTRAVVTLATLATFPALRAPLFARHADALASGYLLLCAAGITLMTRWLGGLASPYYAGLGLAIVATGLLFVWPARVVAATHGGIVLTFVGVNVLSGAVEPLSGAASNLMFLASTATIAGIGQVLAFRSSREQHVQRVRLEAATAKLARAHRDLQQLDQFKSRFFANMTHELRTPLAMVLTPLELALDGEMGEFTESQRSAFGTMFKNALKLLKLVNDLLDLSRLEESRLRLRVRETDLVPALRALVDEIEVLAKRKGIGLRFHAQPERATVLADLDRLERVFVNLLSNAVKFTPPGGNVRVLLAERAERFDVAVEDDGPGFPPEQAETLFERFYQVDMAGTRQHGGAGIGLALARELVHLHGGTIAAASDGRTGARFTVSLLKGGDHLPPEWREEPGPDGAPPREPDFGSESGVHLSARKELRLLDVDEATERRIVERDADEEARPYTVVVVEDHPQVVRLVHMALRGQFRVFTAPDGLRGLEMIAREKPNLVVTDLMMPGIDGLELTRRLREDGRTKHIPVLMLTARGDLEDRVEGLESGVSAYLTKPFSPKELVSCARRLVSAKEETADLVLEQRVESLETFAAGLAHEINNPLNYAKNALSRVRVDVEVLLAAAHPGGGADPAEAERLDRTVTRVRELLRIADSGLRRIASTVELVGEYGRAGFRRGTVPHDVWSAARTVVDLVLPATGRRVKVELDLRGDGTLECVPDEFNQVITNLVQNAIEAAPEDTGHVRVTGRVEDDALVVSVADDGPGISQEVQARLFTPFFTTKGAGRGMGLGLTITRRVVLSLGGTLSVRSAPGHGAEFVVRVPRRRRTADVLAG